VLAAQRVPKPVVSWDAVAWGYIKMGNVQAAESTVQGIHPEYEPTAKWEEARGFLAWNRQDHESAIRHYAKAVDINAGSHVAHYNLAQLYEMTGQPDLALAHADAAWSLAALPEYQAIRQRLQ
jgi:tetratricopeptide (TPR) repeat protein